MNRRHFLTIAASVPLAGMVAPTALAGPRADLWDHWSAHEPQSPKTVDHGRWDRFLARYVMTYGDGINRVAYGAVSQADRDGLKAYLNDLAMVKPTMLSRQEQFAYWVNLYNALTVEVVLDHYPVDSIRDIDISPGLFANGPWGKELIEVEGKQISLDDIEHRILRPVWNDPRIHYAVNCAALGCPNLTTTAFTAANTEALLDAGAYDYVNHDRGFRIENGRLRVSSIYEWFNEDFGGNDAGVIEHLKQYAKMPRRDALASKSKVAGHFYDWQLNDKAGLS